MTSSNPCIICKRTNSLHSHRVNKDWADELSSISGKQVRANQRVCCEHFAPHSTPKFTSKNFPGLKVEFATAYYLEDTKRKRARSDPPGQNFAQDTERRSVPHCY